MAHQNKNKITNENARWENLLTKSLLMILRHSRKCFICRHEYLKDFSSDFQRASQQLFPSQSELHAINLRDDFRGVD